MSTRYIVHTRHPQTQVEQAKIFEADSGAEARKMAESIGLTVLAVEVDAPARSIGVADARDEDPLSGDVGGGADKVYDPRDHPEEETWTGSPSQWTNFWWFASCLLVIPIPWVVWRVLVVATTDYSVTTQRLRLRQGVFNRTIEEVELYRVKDTTLHVPFVQRVLGLGTVIVESSDASMPRLEIPWIRESVQVREQIRQNVEAVRRARGVRELDVN